MTSLELDLFGGFQARVAGQVIDVPGRKERALLALLALPAGERRTRGRLAGLLWGDRGDKQANDSLRQAILRLRKAFDPVQALPLLADRGSVCLDRAVVTVDVQMFEGLAAKRTPQALASAIALYRGDLLDGLEISDPAFEEWLLTERQRLRGLAQEALATLLESHLASGDRDRVGAVARRLLALDPLREATHRALMKIYAEQGQPALALKQYQLCRDALQAELGVRPEVETERLYQSIKEKRAAARSAPPATPAAVASGPALAQPPVTREAHAPAASRPALALPDKPSIAVLPFESMSADPEQAYFADGMVEDITTALSRFRNLFVIARNSSFAYKGGAVDVKQVGRELGVAYVLEGSVRTAGERVRITGQLIDAATGANLWADRIDGALTEVFDLQDQVAASVVGAITPRLEEVEIERAKRKPTGSLDAYDYYLRGLGVINWLTGDANDEALQLFKKAIEHDPNFALAHARAAHCYAFRKANGWMVDRAQEVAEAARLARRAVELGRDDAIALSHGGFVLGYVAGEMDDCASFVEQALALNPNLAPAWGHSGWIKTCFGEPDTAIEHEALAMRLSPLDPRAFVWQAFTAQAHMHATRYDDAAAWAEKALRARPTYANARRVAAASHALAGRLPEAHEHMAQLRQLLPALRISNLGDVLAPLRRAEDRARYVDGLRKAGLPD